MTLAQLEAFVSAARSGTFTAAATSLGLSQPAISDLIRRLEAELGVSVFTRNGRTLLLTPAGEQLLPYADQAVTASRQGSEAVRALLSLDGGTATFGLLRNAEYYIQTDLAKHFKQQHPNVRIRLVGQNSAETVSDVLAGSLEAGLVTLPVDDERLDILPLAKDEVGLVSARPQDEGLRPDISDLCKPSLILYDAHYGSSDPTRRQLTSRASLRGLALEPGIEVEYLATALSLAADGFGDTVACKGAVRSEVEPRGLHWIPFSEPLYDTIALVKRRGQYLSPPTREMARLAHAALLEHQSSDRGTAQLLPGSGSIDNFLWSGDLVPASTGARPASSL